MNKNNRLFRRLLKIKSSDLLKPVIFPCILSMLAISLITVLLYKLIGYFVTPDLGSIISPSLSVEQSDAVMNHIWNMCVFATSMVLTSPLIVGLFSGLCDVFNKKKFSFLSIFSPFSNIQTALRAIISTVMFLAMGFFVFILACLPMCLVFYLARIVSQNLANSFMFQLFILVFLILCVMFAFSEISSYLWIYIPITQKSYYSVWQCFLDTRSVLKKHRWDCFCITIYHLFLIFVTAGLGAFYFVPRYFMNQILLYNACRDLSGKPVNFPPELIPVLEKTSSNDDDDEPKANKKTYDNQKSKYGNFLDNFLNRF